MVSQWNSSGIFPREVKILLYKLGETPENFTRRTLFMSMFNEKFLGTKDTQVECLGNARLVY